jgi:hypothetical protein
MQERRGATGEDHWRSVRETLSEIAVVPKVKMPLQAQQYFTYSVTELPTLDWSSHGHDESHF